MMPEISNPLTLGGQVVNVRVEIGEKPEPEPIPAPVAVAPQEEPRKEEQKLSQKFSTPAAQPNPGGKPSTDAAANGKTGGVLSMPDWVAADQAFKQAQPQAISDGGKGVSN
jgi:hypothetical protein